MLGRRKKHLSGGMVEPDLPITPMLDMSFQLLAFFVTTFNPTPPEGHLDLSLPKDEGGAAVAPPSVSLDEDKEEITVQVDADPRTGDIGGIRLLTKEAAEGKPLGADSKALFDELKARLKDKGSAAKVRLELGEALSYKLVIKLMDEITRAGYKQVAPALIDYTKKG